MYYACIFIYNLIFQWLDYLWDLPTLLRHAGSEFFSVGGIMYMFRLRILLCFVAAVMYLISPLDMIPEAVFGILGLLDDMFVVLLLAIYVTVIYRRFLATRWQNQWLWYWQINDGNVDVSEYFYCLSFFIIILIKSIIVWMFFFFSKLN